MAFSGIAPPSISNPKIAFCCHGLSRFPRIEANHLLRRSQPWWAPPAVVLSCGSRPLAARASAAGDGGGEGGSAAEARTKSVNSSNPPPVCFISSFGIAIALLGVKCFCREIFLFLFSGVKAVSCF